MQFMQLVNWTTFFLFVSPPRHTTTREWQEEGARPCRCRVGVLPSRTTSSIEPLILVPYAARRPHIFLSERRTSFCLVVNVQPRTSFKSATELVVKRRCTCNIRLALSRLRTTRPLPCSAVCTGISHNTEVPWCHPVTALYHSFPYDAIPPHLPKSSIRKWRAVMELYTMVEPEPERLRASLPYPRSVGTAGGNRGMP
jgi:hypothetical protein